MMATLDRPIGWRDAASEAQLAEAIAEFARVKGQVRLPWFEGLDLFETILARILARDGDA